MIASSGGDENRRGRRRQVFVRPETHMGHPVQEFTLKFINLLGFATKTVFSKNVTHVHLGKKNTKAREGRRLGLFGCFRMVVFFLASQVSEVSLLSRQIFGNSGASSDA